MAKLILFSLGMFLLAAVPALASDCSYCKKLEALKAEFGRMAPDPMNEDTIDEQDALVGKAEDLIREIAKKKPSDKDLERIVGLMAVAVPFDYSESLGVSLHGVFKPFVERLLAEVRRQEKEKILSKEEAEAVIISIAMGEEIVNKGTD